MYILVNYHSLFFTDFKKGSIVVVKTCQFRCYSLFLNLISSIFLMLPGIIIKNPVWLSFTKIKAIIQILTKRCSYIKWSWNAHHNFSSFLVAKHPVSVILVWGSLSFCKFILNIFRISLNNRDICLAQIIWHTRYICFMELSLTILTSLEIFYVPELLADIVISSLMFLTLNALDSFVTYHGYNDYMFGHF